MQTILSPSLNSTDSQISYDGSEMKVIGASWFKYGGNYQWSEQLDMYDYNNITNLVKECVEVGVLTEMPKMSADQV